MTVTTERAAVPETGADGAARRKWSRLISIFSLVMVAWAIFITVMSGEFIPPVVIFGVLYLITAAVIRFRPGKAGPIMAIPISIALVAVPAALLIDSLAHPESPFDFITSAIHLVVPLATVVAAVGFLRSWAPERPRALGLATAAVLVVASVVSVGAALMLEDDASLPGDEVMAASDVEFTKTEIRVSAGDVGVFIDNEDPIRHTFTIEELDVDLELPANTARRIDFQAGPGTYEFICAVDGHEDMKGTLVVEG